MASRIFISLTAACCCITLLSPPVHGRRLAGLQQAAGGGLGRLLHELPVPDQPRFEVDEKRRRGVPLVLTTTKARRAWSVRPELRAVPAGPDPMHHHGGSPSRRPEQEQEQDHRTPSP